MRVYGKSRHEAGDFYAAGFTTGASGAAGAAGVAGVSGAVAGATGFVSSVMEL